MIAETIFVGTELLLGNIVNTNATYLAQELAKLGISSYYQTVVGDNKERLKGCIETALSRSDIVILSGGLGPTQDDITKETAAEVFGMELLPDESCKADLLAYFAGKNMQMPECNYKQAMIPKGATVLRNANGTAPGIYMEKDGKIQILLPGPPVELRPMFAEQVIPLLKKEQKEVIVSVMVKACGISESDVAQRLSDLITGCGDVTVAPYAKTGEVHLRVTTRAGSEKDAEKRIKPVIKEIKSKLGDCVYTTHEDVTLEKAVVDLLVANDLTVTTVESCTGGLIAARLINVPGVSSVFKDGYVTYSNRAKRKIAGVKRHTLDKYGAVSEQVVKEMLAGGSAYRKADVVVAVSGIAGPDGGTEEKPVGLVYIGCSVCGEMTVKKYRFFGSREKIRESSVAQALVLMRRCVLEYYGKNTFGKVKK